MPGGTSLVVLVFYTLISAQTLHKWKPLVSNETKKIWIDEASVYSVQNNKFEIWVMQKYVPPIKIEGITGDIYRSEILYAVDLTSVKYGIEKVIYFDWKNKVLYQHDYNITDFEDKLKYTYPVFENSSIHFVIKELYKSKTEKKN